MSDEDDEKVIVTKQSQTFHTNPDCPRIRGFTRRWDRETAESWGRTECQHCDGSPTTVRTKPYDAFALSDTNPEDLGLSPIGKRRDK